MGLALLMTAAGIIFDAHWLALAGLVLLALSALLWGVSHFQKGRGMKIKDKKADQAGRTGIRIAPGTKGTMIVGSTFTDLDTAIDNHGDHSAIINVNIAGKKADRRD